MKVTNAVTILASKPTTPRIELAAEGTTLDIKLDASSASWQEDQRVEFIKEKQGKIFK